VKAAEVERMAALEGRHFWFRARRRALRPWLRRALDAAPRGAWLDLGTGTGGNLSLFEELAVGRDLLACEQDPRALPHVSRRSSRARVVAAEARSLPLEDASIALVTALDVLEHLEDDEGGLCEVARCLVPGGQFVLSVPAHPRLFGAHDRALGHHRRYRRPELRALLERCGFEVQEARAFNSLLLPPVALWRALPPFLTQASRSSDVRPLPPVLNGLLGTIMAVDASLPRRLTDISGLSWWYRVRRRMRGSSGPRTAAAKS